MFLVIAVGAGAEHGRETRADAGPDGVAPVLVGMDVGQAEFAAVGEREIADIDGVGLAVLAQLRGADIVAAAARIGIEIVERRAAAARISSSTARHPRAPSRQAPAPSGSAVSPAAHRDPALIGQDDRGHQHRVGGAAFAGADQNRQRLELGDLGEPDLAGRWRRRGGRACGRVRKRRIFFLRRRELLRNDDRQRPRRGFCRFAVLDRLWLRRWVGCAGRRRQVPRLRRGDGRHAFGHALRGRILRRRNSCRAQQHGDNDGTFHAASPAQLRLLFRL